MMARIRTLKPEFFRSRSLARCPRDARITFAGLWTEADDKGRGVADPRILKGALWALDDDITHLHVSSHLDVLVATGHIRLYESAGGTYYEVVNFDEHQAAAYRRGEPKYPAPETYLEGASHEDVQESAGCTPESAGREGNEEGKGTRKGSNPLSTGVDSESDYEPEFEEFWKAYPKRNGKKVGKPNAVIEWRKLSNAERDRAMTGARHLAASDTLPKDPERFLKRAKGGRGGFPFDDWQEPATPSRNGPATPPPGQSGDDWTGGWDGPIAAGGDG